MATGERYCKSEETRDRSACASLLDMGPLAALAVGHATEATSPVSKRGASRAVQKRSGRRSACLFGYCGCGGYCGVFVAEVSRGHYVEGFVQLIVAWYPCRDVEIGNIFF